MKEIEILFEEFTGEDIISLDELPSSGSNRRYFRIRGTSKTLIGAKGTCVDENIAFWTIAENFHSKGLPVPKVLAHSSDFKYYLQEDLGDDTLFNAISQGREKGKYSDSEKELLFNTIAKLPSIQFEGAKRLNFNICYPQPEFDKTMISFDLNYFKYCFLKATGIDFSEIKLENDFRAMSDILMKSMSDTFLYRDFQARNVMLVDNNPYFIDFQGGRKGPIYYDVASFIWQAKANYSEELKMEMIDTYLEALKPYCPIEKEQFLKTLRHFVLFRTLQVLGAYGFRGYFEKKPHFLQSVPYAMDNIKKLLKIPFEEYPYLSKILLELTTMREFTEMNPERKLEVKIYSFAYKKGIPNDVSGNGGGYVFDCRALENPGKYEHFKHFTGLDSEVIKFMEDEGGVQKFMDKVYSLADVHVQRYIERKFTHLMFSFGCTGGQHRSVYCAQHLAEHIANKFDVKVKLFHREQETEQEF
ncbi:MAG: RNase adapter RapZ [Bacteroidales bacterium]|nr:RNase adapter RapZ [Bacteroidales bacterium]MDD4670977.1 RNase adapter RapZ [Bacteroidales bacterium]